MILAVFWNVFTASSKTIFKNIGVLNFKVSASDNNKKIGFCNLILAMFWNVFTASSKTIFKNKIGILNFKVSASDNAKKSVFAI